MDSRTRKLSWGLVVVAVAFVISTGEAQDSTSVVLAIIAFGDSAVDVGNNDYLPTIFKANYPPYGRDFVNNQPTERFCNGKLATDITAIVDGLFQGFQLPNGGPLLSNLCYADDVLFIGRWSDQNVVTLTRLLRWLRLVTGLKINNRKCKLFGIGVQDEDVAQMAAKLNCEAGVLPFMYLGVQIGANMKRAKFWDPVVNRVGARLSKWKARHLSFAGRVTLAKSVLGSIPAYYLSLFLAPKCIIKKIDRIRRDFIWGITDTRKKFRWVRWDSMLRSKKSGGLGVGRIRDFNLAMLTKWWWRFKVNPNHLWAHVIGSIHKYNTANQLIPVSKSIPGGWKDIGCMDPELHKMGIDIKPNLVESNGFWKWRSSSDVAFSVKQVRSDLEDTLGADLCCIPGFEWIIWAPPKANYLLWSS
ncbi:uncharacterized protein LOC118488252 [Helianthus annuus]|uniref:uncharacterized protein LOC118488252 n=1 Tax=Helianthus annuus TaxID=4232 RepID=UPI001652C924|nr:uncharacterized protein LOC118488252 [Helianthus annuus]